MDADVSCMRSRVMQWVVLGTVAVFLATACSEDDEEPDQSAPSQDETTDPRMTGPVDDPPPEPGEFGYRYWRLLDSELNGEFGFRSTFVDHGIWRGRQTQWFRLSGTIPEAQKQAHIEVTIQSAHDSPDAREYVKLITKEPDDGVFLVAQDLRFSSIDLTVTKFWATYSGPEVSRQWQERFRWSIKKVVSPNAGETAEPSIRMKPGRFGTYYWRLFESELHREMGFEPTLVDNGSRPERGPQGVLRGHERWFTISGRLRDGARVEIYGWYPIIPPAVKHDPEVRRNPEPERWRRNGVFLLARDDDGTVMRADLFGPDVSQAEKDKFWESVASVIQA